MIMASRIAETMIVDRFAVTQFNMEITPITINLDRKTGQPVRLSLHLVPKLQ